MRTGAPDEVLSGSAEYGAVVSSWLGGQLLAERVPVLSGQVTASVSRQVPERLTLRVPRWDGRDWLPGADVAHPLARFGQELSVSIRVRSSVSATTPAYDTQVGRFLVNDWSEESDGVVAVTGVGVLQRVADDRLTSPLAPRPDGTLISEARRLLPLGMFAGFHPGLVNRPCPQSMEWAEDRLDALYEIADAWPARLRVDPWGQVTFLPPLPEVPTPVVTVKDGARGTLLAAPRADTRGGGYNQVVARSSASGVEAIQGVASQLTGPMAVDGPYGAVTKIWSSPLIDSTETAVRSAGAMLRSSLLPTRTIPVQCVADPRLDLDDPVAVQRRDGTTHWGWVVGYELPLTHDGAMRLDVGVAA